MVDMSISQPNDVSNCPFLSLRGSLLQYAGLSFVRTRPGLCQWKYTILLFVLCHLD